jgi:imidazolonepropionase-like amidohydrolase
MGSIQLTNGSVYDVERGTFRRANITLRDGVIEGIHEKTPRIGDSRQIDVDHLYLLPGLIDCHVHLCLPSEVTKPDEWVQQSDAEVALYAIGAARRTLLAGITTVRDCGSWNRVIGAVRNAIKAGRFAGPRIVSAGKQISTTTGSADYMPALFDLGDGPSALAAAARSQIKHGADFFLLIATGAMFSHESEGPDCLTFTREELAAIAAIASDYRRPIAAQGTSPEGIRRLAEIGVTSIEHGIFADEQALELMAQKKVFLVPTLCVAKALLRDSVAAASFPQHIIRRYTSADPTHIEVVRTAQRLGVPIAMGTDAGSPGNHHGRNADECVEMCRRAGMSAEASIRAATCDAARLLGLGNQIGRLAAGMAADIIGCDDNPLEDITALTRIKLVIKDGTMFLDEREPSKQSATVT